jgi:hypothetical protein
MLIRALAFVMPRIGRQAICVACRAGRSMDDFT